MNFCTQNIKLNEHSWLFLWFYFLVASLGFVEEKIRSWLTPCSLCLMYIRYYYKVNKKGVQCNCMWVFYGLGPFAPPLGWNCTFELWVIFTAVYLHLQCSYFFGRYLPGTVRPLTSDDYWLHVLVKKGYMAWRKCQFVECYSNISTNSKISMILRVIKVFWFPNVPINYVDTLKRY